MTATPTATAHFEPGVTYFTRSIVDHAQIIRVTVASRTAKTIVTSAGKRLHIRVDPLDGAETVKPFGSYSMCPVVSAGRPV